MLGVRYELEICHVASLVLTIELIRIIFPRLEDVLYSLKCFTYLRESGFFTWHAGSLKSLLYCTQDIQYCRNPTVTLLESRIRTKFLEKSGYLSFLEMELL
ncbi:uncharacterized protein isoform X2 [Rhodnius prolixus]|uniref:uncharacterized protein isoform X2 n=1 Tax=Rhodnius prolixus TaxID=13249 RepID=UPI003D18A932